MRGEGRAGPLRGCAARGEAAVAADHHDLARLHSRLRAACDRQRARRRRAAARSAPGVVFGMLGCSTIALISYRCFSGGSKPCRAVRKERALRRPTRRRKPPILRRFAKATEMRRLRMLALCAACGISGQRVHGRAGLPAAGRRGAGRLWTTPARSTRDGCRDCLVGISDDDPVLDALIEKALAQNKDLVLDALIEKALAQNKDLLTAAARVDEFYGRLMSTRSGLFPQLGADFGGGRQRTPATRLTPAFESTSVQADLQRRGRSICSVACAGRPNPRAPISWPANTRGRRRAFRSSRALRPATSCCAISTSAS